VRARALRAPAKLGLLTCQTGRCAPLAHGSFAASDKSPKNNYFQKQIASILDQTRALPTAASLILSAIFWGQNVLVRPYALTFLGFSFFVWLLDLFFLLFSSYSSLLFNFFLFISAYPSFLTSSYSSHRYYASSSYSSILIF
jgi:hypothetical protein